MPQPVLEMTNPFARMPYGPRWHSRFFDFISDIELATSSWAHNVTNSTAPTTVTDAAGGVATFTNTTGTDDRVESQAVCESISLAGLNQEAWFTARVKFSEATEVDYFLGFAITDTDIVGDTAVASDLIGFEKNDGDTNIDFILGKDVSAAADYTRAAAIGTLVADTYNVYTFYVKTDATTAGTALVIAWLDGVKVLEATYTADVPNDELMTLSMLFQNGSGAAHVMSVDYIGYANSR